MKTILATRQPRQLDQSQTIPDDRFGRRASCLTHDTNKKVMAHADVGRIESWRERRFYLEILLDECPISSSMPWEVLMRALSGAEISLPQPAEQYRTSHFRHRWIAEAPAEGTICPMTAGIPRGSILEPTPWPYTVTSRIMEYNRIPIIYASDIRQQR